MKANQQHRTPTGDPNILIIYPDQMRGDCLSYAGNPCIKTPHIDRLAYEGVLFENAFTSFPLCSPFRASFFTGKYAQATGIFANHYTIPLDQDFLPQIFREHGYQTGYFGKWHLDGGKIPGFVPPGERRLGFDHFIGFNRGHHYFGSVYYKDSVQPYTSRRYEPDYQTDQLIDYMERCQADPGGRPFFAMINYGPPHPPLEAPENYLGLYSPEEVPILDPVPEDAASRRAAREFLAKYYGLIACVDHNVGRLLGWLDRQNLVDDTVVIFVSDHGELAGEHGRYAKKNYHRAAMHVPLIVRNPKRFPAGHIVRSIVDPSVDSMPTLLELCGFPIPESVQGVSYLSHLEGSDIPTRKTVYYKIFLEMEGPERYPVPERGVRSLEWLYVRDRGSPIALYDLKEDPHEMNNLAGSMGYLDVISKLDNLLVDHMVRTADDWDLGAVFPPHDYHTYDQGDRNVASLLEHAIIEP